ncbi:hypothetical protein [Ekhidna sp.]
MFLRKLFNAENKLIWVLIDLIIVVMGVYIAFLIQSSANDQKDKREQMKVLSGLKYELEEFRILFPGRSSYANNLVQRWKSSERNEQYIDFSDWIFIEPQYSYQIVKYAVELENADIIDFQLFNVIQNLYNSIKSLEHTDRLVMETSRKYRRLHDDMSGAEKLNRNADNFENFQFFIRFFAIRGDNLARVAQISEEALKTINERLSLEERKTIEASFMNSNIEIVDSEEKAVQMAKLYFKDFTEDEIRELYRKATQVESDTIPN